jgi:hypothetical protein
MTTTARWDTGVFGDSRWDTIVEQVSGAITEAPDNANGLVVQVISASGAITELPDTAIGYLEVPGAVYGDITENPDVVYGRVQVKYAYRGGWAPQFHYRREWEPEPEAPAEELKIEVELEPEFIPQPLPIDPTVARMIEIMMRGPQVISTDDDDLESILMNL